MSNSAFSSVRSSRTVRVASALAEWRRWRILTIAKGKAIANANAPLPPTAQVASGVRRSVRPLRLK